MPGQFTFKVTSNCIFMVHCPVLVDSLFSKNALVTSDQMLTVPIMGHNLSNGRSAMALRMEFYHVLLS